MMRKKIAVFSLFLFLFLVLALIVPSALGQGEKPKDEPTMAAVKNEMAVLFKDVNPPVESEAYQKRCLEILQKEYVPADLGNIFPIVCEGKRIDGAFHLVFKKDTEKLQKELIQKLEKDKRILRFTSVLLFEDKDVQIKFVLNGFILLYVPESISKAEYQILRNKLKELGWELFQKEFSDDQKRLMLYFQTVQVNGLKLHDNSQEVFAYLMQSFPKVKVQIAIYPLERKKKKHE